MIYIKKKDRLYEYDITGSRVNALSYAISFFLSYVTDIYSGGSNR